MYFSVSDIYVPLTGNMGPDPLSQRHGKRQGQLEGHGMNVQVDEKGCEQIENIQCYCKCRGKIESHNGRKGHGLHWQHYDM